MSIRHTFGFRKYGSTIHQARLFADGRLSVPSHAGAGSVTIADLYFTSSLGPFAQQAGRRSKGDLHARGGASRTVALPENREQGTEKCARQRHAREAGFRPKIEDANSKTHILNRSPFALPFESSHMKLSWVL